MREPIIWFLLIGAVLFGADHYLANESETIVVDDLVRTRLSSLWLAQMGNQVTQEQLSSLVDAWIKEEVLYREAIRLNLDRDDTIVRRRLVQKLEFLTEGVDDELPSQQNLEAFYSENIAQYSEPQRYSFSQIYFSSEAQAMELAASLSDQIDWKALGDNSMLNDRYIARSRREIGNILGSQFAEVVESFVLDQWAGPFQSSFGHHFVRLERIDESFAIPLLSIEARVVRDYQEVRKQSKLKDHYQSLLGKTHIVHR